MSRYKSGDGWHDVVLCGSTVEVDGAVYTVRQKVFSRYRHCTNPKELAENIEMLAGQELLDNNPADSVYFVLHG